MFDIISKMIKRTKNIFKENMLFILLLLFAFLIRSYKITEHWVGHHDFNGAFFSIVAINHIRYGYLATKFWDVPILTTPDLFYYHIKHPPLVGILVSTSFRIFDIHEWSARLVPILFSIGALILLYSFIKKIWNEKIALFSSFFFAFMPMAAYFGRMVSHEPIVLFSVLLSLYSYILWIETYKKRWFWLMIFGFVLGGLTDWPAYYIVPLIFLHSLLFKRSGKKNMVLMLFFPIIAILLFVSCLAYISFLTGSIEGLIGAFIYRTGSAAADSVNIGSFTIYQFFSREWHRTWQYFTPIVVLLAFIWLGNFIIEIVKKKNYQKDLYVLILFLFGGAHLLIFKQGAWIHDYWLYYTVPAFAISAALGIELIQKGLEKVKIEKGFPQYFLKLRQSIEKLSNVLSPIVIFASGASFGFFVWMVRRISDSATFTTIPLFIIAGILIYVAVWIFSSKILAKLTNERNKMLSRLDAYTYLPSILLLFYTKQFFDYTYNFGVYLVLITIVLMILSKLLLFEDKVRNILEQKAAPSKLQTKAYVISIITILILSVFLVQAIPFTKQIHDWGSPQFYDFGMMINEKTSQNESVMATQLTYARVPQVRYYAKRYIHIVNNENDFQNAMKDSSKNYRYFIVGSDIFKYKDLKEDLFNNYSFTAEKCGVIFDLTKKSLHNQLTSNISSYKIAVNFSNKIQLLGYNISTLNKEGRMFYIEYYWQSLQKMNKNYTIFVHFTSNNGTKMMFQQDHLPAYGMHQTSKWKPGEIIKEEYFVSVPQDVPSGTYDIRIGLWYPPTEERLPTDSEYSDGTDGLIIGIITVITEAKMND